MLRLAAVLVPLLGVASAGLATWQEVERAARARIARTVDLLQQNALRTLDTHEAIMASVARAAAGRSMAALREDRAFHALLASLAGSAEPAVSDVLLADETGRIIAASRRFPAPPGDPSDNDGILDLRETGRGRAIGAPFASPVDGGMVIPLARSLAALADDPRQGGLVVSTFSPAVLSAFYAGVAESPGDVVVLFRRDGLPLAQHPSQAAPPPERLRAASAMLDELLAPHQSAAWVRSPSDDVPRLFVARALGPWPAAVAYGLDRRALVATWRERMVAPALGGVAALALLLTLTNTAQREARRRERQAEQRAEAELQLAQAGRAATIGLLSAGLAHEVKNLVQAVRSGARVMQQHAADPAEVRRCAELLDNAATRGGRLVQAMLASARGDAAGEQEPGSFDVHAAMLELTELLGRTFGAGWPVRAQLPPALPEAVGDRAGFDAAIVNLAANARDAMPRGGTVTLAAWLESLSKASEPEGLQAGDYVVAAVFDTGLGMDAATMARLGEPFFTTKPPGVGTGLGLAAVRGFCARAGGALRITSEPGQGSCFAIWLPAA